MAQYEEAASNVVDTITNSGLSDTTKSAITDLLGDTSGDAKIVMATYDGNKVGDDVKIVDVPADAILSTDPGAPIIVMNADSQNGANVVLSADKERAIVATKQADTIVFEGDSAVTVETGGGNDTIQTGSGSDSIVITGDGDSTIGTGDGNDTVIVRGYGTTHITSGNGDSVYWLQTLSAIATVVGGDGFDRVVMGEDRSAHTFNVDPATGTAVMHSDNTITMTGVQVVGFDKNADGQITSVDNISILAENANDSLIGKLYKVALGREAIDGADGWGHSTLGGINWWMNQFEKGQTDGTIEHLVRSFLNCDEFHAKYDNISNSEYVNTLFANLGLDDANLAAEYLGQLDTGVMDREQVAWDLAESKVATQIMGLDGSHYVIDIF